MAGANEHNRKSLLGMVESYRDMLFPGMESKSSVNTDEENAKKALAEEAKKLYLVRPYDEVTDDTWKEMAKKGGDAAFIAHRQLRERNQFTSRMRAKLKDKKQ